MTDRSELLDIGQAAAMLNVSVMSLRRWTNAGALPCLRIGLKRERRFRREDLLAFMEDQPASGPPTARSPVGAGAQTEFIGGIALTFGTHLVALYGGSEARMRQAAAFLADGGLRPGAVSILVAEPDAANAILAYLERSRPSLRDDITAGRLIVSTYADSRQQHLEYCEKTFVAVTRAGARAVRVVGDIWGLACAVGAGDLVACEAGYDQIARRFPVVTMCQYDVGRFSGPELLDALKGHADTFRYPVERILA